MACYASLALGSITALALAGCGASQTEVTASQVDARVNKVEITDYQLDAELARAPEMRATPETSVSRQVLTQLIDQELLMEKARAAGMDHTPAVVEGIEAAKRRVLADAWQNYLVARVTPPSDQTIAAYYNEHADFFASRRMFVYESIALQAAEAKDLTLKGLLKNPINFEGLCSYRKANSEGCEVKPEVKATEELSSDTAARLSPLRAGEVTTLQDSDGVSVVHILSNRLEPVDEAHARPYIQGFLLKQKRQERIDAELAALRGGAQIRYVGPYAVMNQ